MNKIWVGRWVGGCVKLGWLVESCVGPCMYRINVREDLDEKNIDLTRIGEATRNREVWRNLVRASSSAR